MKHAGEAGRTMTTERAKSEPPGPVTVHLFGNGLCR